MGKNVFEGWHIEGYKDFPVCNHTKDIGPENIGYQTGMFCDGLPFEVEIYEYGQGENHMKELAVIMPDIYVEEDDVDDYDYVFDHAEIEDSEDLDWGYNEYYEKVPKSNVEGFRYEMTLKEYSALPIGMVLRGQEDSFPIISWYQEFIEEMGIVTYTSDIRSCSVFYYTDINGNDLVQVRTGLVSNGKEEAICGITLNKFPIKGIRTGNSSAKFKVIK